jgi:hypothetical protein
LRAHMVWDTIILRIPPVQSVSQSNQSNGPDASSSRELVFHLFECMKELLIDTDLHVHSQRHISFLPPAVHPLHFPHC